MRMRKEGSANLVGQKPASGTATGPAKFDGRANFRAKPTSQVANKQPSGKPRQATRLT